MCDDKTLHPERKPRSLEEKRTHHEAFRKKLIDFAITKMDVAARAGADSYDIRVGRVMGDAKVSREEAVEVLDRTERFHKAFTGLYEAAKANQVPDPDMALEILFHCAQMRIMELGLGDSFQQGLGIALRALDLIEAPKMPEGVERLLEALGAAGADVQVMRGDQMPPELKKLLKASKPRRMGFDTGEGEVDTDLPLPSSLPKNQKN